MDFDTLTIVFNQSQQRDLIYFRSVCKKWNTYIKAYLLDPALPMKGGFQMIKSSLITQPKSIQMHPTNLLRNRNIEEVIMKRGLFYILSLAIVISFLVTAYAGQSDGLLTNYPFNGNAIDQSRNGNDGTINAWKLANR